MNPERTSIQRWFQSKALFGLGSAVLFVVSLAMPFVATAETLYSYIDEKGTPVLTDDYNSIPERYRAKVKTTERAVSPQAQTTPFGVVHNTATNWGKKITGAIPNFAPEISGLSPAQSKILTTAGVVGFISVIAMYLSRSQVIKFLSLWTLVLTGIVTPVLLYTAEGGASDVMKKASDSAKKQQERLQQVP